MGEDLWRICIKYMINAYDSRFGMFQPIYNRLKREGLNAYYAKAKWGEYTSTEKVVAYIKYGIFFLYIYLSDVKIKIKNKMNYIG